MMGLAFDLGRVYIVKNEAQSFADAAAIQAAQLLDGKKSGIDAAIAAVNNSANRWNWNTSQFTAANRKLEFSTAQTGPWVETPPNPPTNYAFVRVTVTPLVRLAFLGTVQKATTQVVPARAVAGQIPQTFPSGGYLPFTPFAHDANDPNYGFIPGQEYGILWPGNLKKQDACAGDRLNWPAYDMSDNNVLGGSDRGYFEFQAASAIYDAIMGLRQTSPLAIGDIVPLTNGQKQAMQTGLENRAKLDTDTTAYQPNTTGVKPPYYGNGMRLVIMPVNGPHTVPPNKVLGFASFLLPMNFPNGGNKAWCAIYMGSAVAGGGTSAYGNAGAYVSRLVL